MKKLSKCPDAAHRVFFFFFFLFRHICVMRNIGQKNASVSSSWKKGLFSHSVVSDPLWPHGLQHTRLPCPSPFPGVCSNSCPLSWWCHPTIPSSVSLFSFCLQSFPVSGSFPMSQLSTSGGWSIGASASVFPMNIQGWFPLGLTGFISLLSKGFSRVISNTTAWQLSHVSALSSLNVFPLQSPENSFSTFRTLLVPVSRR